MFSLNKKTGSSTSSKTLSFTTSWKKKYEEEAKSKFNLLLQVQEQQRIIQEQRRIIDKLRSEVNKLGKKPPLETKIGNTNNVNKLNNNMNNTVGKSSLVRPGERVLLSINTSGVDSTASSISPNNRSAPVSPAMATNANAQRRKSWNIKQSSLRYSPKTTGTIERADPLSPGLKAANLEFGRRKSFTVMTHSDWLKTQRLRRTSLSGDRSERRLSKSSIPSTNDAINENQLQDQHASYMRNATKKRSMTMDDASKLENIILEARLRSSPKFYDGNLHDDDNDVGNSNNHSKSSDDGTKSNSQTNLFSSVRDESFLQQNAIDHLGFELFLVSGIHPTTKVDATGSWQPDIIFQFPSSKSHAFNSSRLDSSNLSDFTFPEGVESFYVDDDDVVLEKMKIKRQRHYFTLTDSNEVYHGFCLTISHPVQYGNKAEEQFILIDKQNIILNEADDDAIVGVKRNDLDDNDATNEKKRPSSILEETGDLLDSLGEIEPELPTAFVKPNLLSFSQDDIPDQPKKIQYVIPETIPKNKNVKVVIGDTQCIFTIPENALPGQTLTVELPLNPVMVKVRKRTNSIEPSATEGEETGSGDSTKILGDAVENTECDLLNTNGNFVSENSVNGTVGSNGRHSRTGSISNSTNEPENWNKVLYMKRSYCFVSKYQQYDLHFKMLERIATMDVSSNISKMDEKNKSLYQEEDFKSISAVLKEYRDVNLDQFQSSNDELYTGNVNNGKDKNKGVISIAGPTKMFTSSSSFTWPFNAKVSPTPLLNAAAPKWTVIKTFQLLSFENIIQILSTLLMEKSVAIVSSDAATSYAVSCAFTALLTPLEWQATFVPCLPSRLWNFLLAPVPFLVGLTSVPDHIESLPDVTFLLVDSNEIKNPASLRFPNASMIMSDQILNISEDLNIIAANKRDDLTHGDHVYQLEDNEDEIVNFCVRTCKDYVNGILGDVRVHCIRNISSNDTSQSYVFLKDSYLERRNSFIGGAQNLYITRLVNTQMFSSWVDEVMINDEV
jgi:hypothetical protein